MFHVKQVEYRVKTQGELFNFLLEQMPDTSRTKVKELLAHNVCVDGRKVSQYNFPLMPGMVVTIEKAGYKERLKPRDLDIIYEDNHLLVINKHEGLLSYSKKPGDNTVITVLNRYLSITHQKCTAHIVHRLDRDTSGLMVVAKTKQVSQLFEADWKGLVSDRAYVAVAWGKMEPSEGTIRSWLTDGQYCVLSSPTDNGGKLAVTNYRVVKTSRRYSLMELRLDTGRRNQIRVHLREEKHPVVHDPMYGYKNDVSPINRLALHAFRLGFKHPVTGKQLTFETPYPSSFMKLMEL
ncbi:MAG: RluA family pseudouridine synthase [Bacteroidales bacterium]|nr:RluA family pseudouridine synthase [Candidatus Colimorpha merdihippi]